MENRQKVPGQFIIKLQGKDYVLFEGLLDLAHREGLRRVETELVQAPTSENGMLAIVRAQVETEKGIFSGIGDASPESVNRMMAPHTVRLAETRALARALRFAVNIGMTTFEELGDETGLDESEMKAEDVVISFGKYANKSLGTIYKEDRSYLDWLSANARDPVVREAARKLRQGDGKGE
ncbi:MAG: hypothetical protein ACOX8W_09420 [bacterium]|jgi:hypothetical protein